LVGHGLLSYAMGVLALRLNQQRYQRAVQD